MRVNSITQHNLELARLDRIRLQERLDDSHRKVVEDRNFERIIAERVARNIRLGNDKGRNIDVEC